MLEESLVGPFAQGEFIRLWSEDIMSLLFAIKGNKNKKQTKCGWNLYEQKLFCDCTRTLS